MNFKRDKPNCECGTSALRSTKVFQSGEVDFRRCLTCGLVFRECFPGDAELVNIYREAYGAENISRGATNQESGLHAAKSYSAFVQQYITRYDARVLDYGAGSGQLVAELRSRGIRADGLEFSSEARQFCERHRAFKLIGDLAGVRDSEYSFILMIEVIEHLVELQNTLNEIYRVLAPGGTLLITTPNIKGYRSRKDRGYWSEARKKFHLFLFNEDSLNYHLTRAGFSDLRRIFFGPLQRSGLKFWLTARISQSVGLGGSLCVLARKK